jgi:hypothetical protein
MEKFFHRPALAKRISDIILSDKGTSGFFISAPRRTGKSTLIKEDISPELIKRGAHVILVDLWSDRSQEPSKLIADAIRKSFLDNASLWDKVKKVANKATLPTFGNISLESIGIGQSVTLSDALVELSNKIGKIIVMVIDEAQHAMTTSKGSDALYALKAARDLLNASDHHGFRLVATGSSRDKLSILVHGKDQAFYNANLFDLPHLGSDYLQWELDEFPLDFKPSLAALELAFSQTGFKPEILRHALNQIMLDLDANASNADDKFLAVVSQRLGDMQQQAIKEIRQLPPLEYAVLVTMVEHEESFAPFRMEFTQKYAKVCAELTQETVNINTSSIQYALDQLREKGLVWKSARGVYALEETHNKELVLAAHVSE